MISLFKLLPLVILFLTEYEEKLTILNPIASRQKRQNKSITRFAILSQNYPQLKDANAIIQT